MEWSAGGVGGPDALALPALAGIVDASVESLPVVAHRIRNAERQELTID